MACQSRSRTSQAAQLLSEVVTTEQQSLTVVKKLLAVAVSCITYLRGLFPEKAYGSKYVEEQKVMILREDRSCPGARQIVQWMHGCFDALQKKYVSKLLCFFLCRGKVTECYQFRVQYTENGSEMDFESHNNKIMKMGFSDTRKASVLLVRKLYTLMQNLGPLPDSVYLNMKLSYYDDVTPQEYQPPGFKEGGTDGLVFEKDPIHLTMGEVLTPFHILKVDVTTERERLEQIDDKETVYDADRHTLPTEQKQQDSTNKIMSLIQNHSHVKKDNSDNQTNIKNSVQVSCQEQVKIYQEIQHSSQCSQVDSLVKTTDSAIAVRRTRSGQVFNSALKVENEEHSTGSKRKTKENHSKSMFAFPISQESNIPKRRKFSEPKERY
ncbi:HORMA domain-containing protein 1 isoform X1 [Arapaima gigas]